MKKCLMGLMAAALIGTSAFGEIQHHVFWYNCIKKSYTITDNPGPNLPVDCIKHEGMMMTSNIRQNGFNTGSHFIVGNYDGGNGNPGFCGVVWSKDLMEVDFGIGVATQALFRAEYCDLGGSGIPYCTPGNIYLRVGVVDFINNITDVWDEGGDPASVPATAIWNDASNHLGFIMNYDTDTTNFAAETAFTLVAPQGVTNDIDDAVLDKQFMDIDITSQVNWIISHTGSKKGKYSGQYAIAFVVNISRKADGKINGYTDETGGSILTASPWTKDGNTGHIVVTINTDPNEAVEKTKTNIPAAMYLGNNSPNPVKITTTISYNTGSEREGVFKVYNISGKTVFSSSVKGKGSINWNPDKLSSGIYMYRLTVGHKSIVRGMILTR